MIPFRTYLLDTVSEEERTQWVEAVNKAIKAPPKEGAAN